MSDEIPAVKYSRSAKERLQGRIGSDLAILKALRLADVTTYYVKCRYCGEFHTSTTSMNDAVLAWAQHIETVRHQRQLVLGPRRQARSEAEEKLLREIFGRL